jgi:hypothetical protein
VFLCAFFFSAVHLYRKSAPDKPVFVEVGSTSKGDVVCVIEAMKLFNEIESAKVKLLKIISRRFFLQLSLINHYFSRSIVRNYKL